MSDQKRFCQCGATYYAAVAGACTHCLIQPAAEVDFISQCVAQDEALRWSTDD